VAGPDLRKHSGCHPVTKILRTRQFGQLLREPLLAQRGVARVVQSFCHGSRFWAEHGVQFDRCSHDF